MIDHLAGTSLNVAAMDVDVTSVQFNGPKADVMVTFRPVKRSRRPMSGALLPHGPGD